MTTPAIILGLLIGPHLVRFVADRFLGQSKPIDSALAGALGLSLVLTFTGIGHFVKTQGMIEMLPTWVPQRLLGVQLTGIAELLVAGALLIPTSRRPAGWCLIVMLVAFLPVNIYAAVNRVGLGGHVWGPVYLLIRVPLQGALIGWTWWFVTRNRASKAA